MRKLIDLDHVFFARPWRRHLTVAVCVLWGLFELSMGAVLWAALFFGIGAVAVVQFCQIDWSKYEDGA